MQGNQLVQNLQMTNLWPNLVVMSLSKLSVQGVGLGKGNEPLYLSPQYLTLKSLTKAM